jgi:hypothetical protein
MSLVRLLRVQEGGTVTLDIGAINAQLRRELATLEQTMAVRATVTARP